MRPDWVDQAHQDPSLGRLRPRSIPRQTVDPLDQLEKVEAGEPAPRDRIRTVDAILAIAIVFLVAVLLVSRLMADAQCGMYHG